MVVCVGSFVGVGGVLVPMLTHTHIYIYIYISTLTAQQTITSIY